MSIYLSSNNHEPSILTMRREYEYIYPLGEVKLSPNLESCRFLWIRPFKFNSYDLLRKLANIHGLFSGSPCTREYDHSSSSTQGGTPCPPCLFYLCRFPRFPSTLVPFSLIRNHVSMEKATIQVHTTDKSSEKPLMYPLY